MFDEQRLGNDGTEASRPRKPDDGDNQMKEKDDDIAHPGMVSKPEKTPNFGPIQEFAMDKFHGNLYEIWNGSILNAANYFTNATPGNRKPRSTVNHFGGSLGGPILHDKLFFFFDSEWVRIALPIVTPTTVPTVAFQNHVLQQLPLG